MTLLASATTWPARLQLEFASRAGRTVLTKRTHHGPLVVQKPFYPGDGACHVYVLHPPGGLVGGDQLELQVLCQTHSQVLLTTPAASKFYRSLGERATIAQDLKVETEASLEWLPQETILYSGCQAGMRTTIQLAPGARFIGWEILCLGRPAAKQPFAAGVCQQSIEVWRDGCPIVIERARLHGGSDVLQAAWGFAGYDVSATLIATPVDARLLDAVRAIEIAAPQALTAATLIDDVLICRFLGAQARQALDYFQRVWTCLRPEVVGLIASPPRIWAT
jgi:urease accessory protein